MAGNVWEWTADVWQSYSGAQRPFRNPKQRALHGGAYRSAKSQARCSARIGRSPGASYDNGFRIALFAGRSGDPY
jgi:formylglycine-generating enzyme required for sulfatase activity